MDELKYINSIYRRALLFDGFYDGERVEFNRNRHRFNRFIQSVALFVFSIHLFILFTDNERFKSELIYFRLSDDFGSKYLNFAGGLLLLARYYQTGIFTKFTKHPEKFKCFNFLFCFSTDQMHTKYMLSKKRSEDQIKDQEKLLKIAVRSFRFIVLTFGLFIFKIARNNLKNSIKFNQFYLDHFIIIIKITFYPLFAFTLISFLLASRLNINELILSCKYLSRRLDDQTDQILKIFSTNRFNDQKYVRKKVLKLCQNYNSIIRIRVEMERHFDKTLNFFVIFLIFTILIPAMIVLDPNKSTVLFYSSNYLFILTYLSSLFHFNTKFLNSNSRFWKNLSSLAKYIDFRSSSKIYNIFLLNFDTNLYSFTFKGFFDFVFKFLIIWLIEVMNLIFLLHQGLNSQK